MQARCGGAWSDDKPGGPMRRGLSDERGPLRRGQLETQSGSLLERIRRGRAAALPEHEEPLTGLLALP